MSEYLISNIRNSTRKSESIGSGSLPFVRVPGATLPMRYARIYFWSKTESNKYEKLPLETAVNGMAAFSDRVDEVSPGEVPGSGTDAGYAGPFIYRLR